MAMLVWPSPGSQKGEAALDWWTLVHLASGAAVALIGIGWLIAVSALVGYEALEAGLRRIKRHGGKGLFEYESWPNIIVDIVVAIAAYALARWVWPVDVIVP